MDAQRHSHIRKRLEGHLRRELPEEMWLDLQSMGYVGDAADREGWDGLVREARRLFGYIELGSAGAIPRRTPTVARRTPIEARGRANSAWMARLEQTDRLEAARATWGGLMSREEASASLRSVAWSLVPLQDLVDRVADGMRPGDAARIRGTQARVVGRRDEVRTGVRGVRFVIEIAYGGYRRELAFWHRRLHIVKAEVASGEPIRTVVGEGTFAYSLSGLAEQARAGTPFTVPQMLWFLLTDEGPEVRPLAIGSRVDFGPELRSRSIVTLEVEPWVPVEAVASAYREARAEAIGRSNRPLRERSLELARFLAAEGWGLSVREQMRLWNGSHQRWQEHDPRNFRKDAQRAVTLLLGPPGPLSEIGSTGI